MKHLEFKILQESHNFIVSGPHKLKTVIMLKPRQCHFSWFPEIPIVPCQSKPVNTNGITNLQSWTSQIYITWQPCGYGWHGTMEWWFHGKSSLEHQVQYPHATGLKHSTEGTYSLPWNNAEHSSTSIQNFHRTYVYTKTCTWEFIAKKKNTDVLRCESFNHK